MWFEYLHHITVHVPLVGSAVLAGIGTYWVKSGADELGQVVRWLGWAVLAATTVAVVTGILSAPGGFGGDGPKVVSDHRNLGLTTFWAMATAVVAFEWGLRSGSVRAKKFGALVWWAVLLGAIGTGHWGGSSLHSDVVPWDGSQPAYERSFQGGQEQ